MSLRAAVGRILGSLRSRGERPARLPTAGEVALSRHCVEQFKLRFRPGLGRAGARAELERLLVHAEVVEEMPAWLAATARSEADAYLLIGPDMVLPVARNGKDPRWVAKTCLARGSISHARRQERNKAAKRGRVARRSNRR